MTGSIGMPQTGPNPERWSLGFVSAVRSSFDFLEDLGFAVVVEESTFVRFESGAVFVNVFHGRGSYELGVEIGHRVELGGETVDEKFSLGDVVALSAPLGEVGFQSFATTKAEELPAFIDRLADWTSRYGGAALRDETGIFVRLRSEGVKRSDAMQDEWAAGRLRTAADAAWSERDYARVVGAYSEMISELRSIELRPSELRRLRFAEAHLGG